MVRSTNDYFHGAASQDAAFLIPDCRTPYGNHVATERRTRLRIRRSVVCGTLELMEFKYFDAHCHVQFGQYDADRDAVIERMREESVGGLVVGCDLESSQRAVDLARKHEHLFAAVGHHPNDTALESFNELAITALAADARVVAIGECGLDYFRPIDATDEVKEKQKEVFKKQIALAGTIGKPLIIHSRPSKGTQDAYHDVIEILTEAKKKYPNLHGDIHFFVGGIEEMKVLTALGFTVSFTAVITFTHDYDAVIKATPLEFILSETDAPYLAPAARRGQRNDPLAVQDVVTRIAEIRGENTEVVRLALLGNAERLFGLIP